ncbi:MAG: DUF2953 domain-containing protein [Oscillospiraceae bacterium]|nr:DUF2953 domain-containing protein [Oscillospiraceae bacterium]
MCFFLLIFAIILLLGFVPLGVSVRYSENGFSCFFKLLFFKVNLPKRKKPKSETTKEPKKPGKLEGFKQVVFPAVKTLQKLLKTICIKKLVADIKIASGDSFRTAMLYGGCASAFGLIFPIAENNLKIKKKYITVNADFEETETKVYFFCELYLNLWQLIYIAGYFIFKYLKEKRKDLL